MDYSEPRKTGAVSILCRSAAAKSLEESPVRLAVIAHIHHVDIPYDSLLAKGQDRRTARVQIEERVDKILSKWEQ